MRSAAAPATLAIILATGPGCGQAAAPGAAAPPRLLVMSKTGGFRHNSIADGRRALEKIAAEHGFAVRLTEDAGDFSVENLASYTAVVFLNTTGDILDTPQEAALESFIRSGKGFVGIHAATDTESEWAWYGGLVGARFDGHGPVEPATLDVVDETHGSTSHLSKQWPRSDEWYRFRDIGNDLHMLVTRRDADGVAHPVAWYQRYDGGRSWYTAGGHTSESYAEPAFLAHLAGGILWVME